MGAPGASEQVDGQRHGTDKVGDLVVAEADVPRPILPGEHADAGEHEQQRRPGARRERAGKNAQQHQNGADQDGVVVKIQVRLLVCLPESVSSTDKASCSRKLGRLSPQRTRRTQRKNKYGENFYAV